jgi:hypothetical protein
MDQEMDSSVISTSIIDGDGSGVTDSNIDLGPSELLYPIGYIDVCAECGYLNWLYGPEDGELATHIANGHRDPDFDSYGANFYIPTDAVIPSPEITLANEAFLNHNSPAN